jgi:hypothetical protein
MSDVFRKEGFRFFFYSNEHLPIHVHVRHGGGEAFFGVGEPIELRESQAITTFDLRRAQELAEEQEKLRVAK